MILLCPKDFSSQRNLGQKLNQKKFCWAYYIRTKHEIPNTTKIGTSGQMYLSYMYVYPGFTLRKLLRLFDI